jgi:hypothetical protein
LPVVSQNRYRSNALAQEKTGEFWVNGKMIGAGTHGDFEQAELLLRTPERARREAGSSCPTKI